MPNTRSQDLFGAQSAVKKSLSKADLHRLYWQTSNQGVFQGSQLRDDDKGEDYGEVWNVGHKTTKYWKFPERTAPLLDRTACGYCTDYYLKPADDTFENRDFAKSIKGVTKMASAPSFSVSSTAQDSFRPDVAQEARRTFQFSSTNDRNERTKTLGGFGASYERVSKSHREHSGPRRNFPSKAPPIKQAHNMLLTGARPLEFWTTQYQRDGAVCAAATWSSTSHMASPKATALGTWAWPPEAAKARLMLALPPSVETPTVA